MTNKVQLDGVWCTSYISRTYVENQQGQCLFNVHATNGQYEEHSAYAARVIADHNEVIELRALVESQRAELEGLKFDLSMEQNTREEWLLTDPSALNILRRAGWKPPEQAPHGVQVQGAEE